MSTATLTGLFYDYLPQYLTDSVQKVYTKIPSKWVFKPLIFIPYNMTSVITAIALKFILKSYGILGFSWKEIMTQNCKIDSSYILTQWMQKNYCQPIDLPQVNLLDRVAHKAAPAQSKPLPLRTPTNSQPVFACAAGA